MARGAIARYAGVIEDLRRKTCGRMTNITILSRRQVVHRCVLTGGEAAVVATCTATGDALMIEDRGWKTVADDVARITIVSCRDVIERLAGRDASGVAGRTVIHNARVIEDRVRKHIRRMAKRAILRRWHVISSLPRCVLAVVT